MDGIGLCLGWGIIALMFSMWSLKKSMDFGYWFMCTVQDCVLACPLVFGAENS